MKHMWNQVNRTVELRELGEYCTQRGWEITSEYVDHISGAKDKRPELDHSETRNRDGLQTQCPARELQAARESRSEECSREGQTIGSSAHFNLCSEISRAAR